MDTQADSAWDVLSSSLANGVFQAILAPVGHGGDGPPELVATAQGAPVDGLDLTRTDAGWSVTLTLPPTMLGDGVQTLVLTNTATGGTIGSCHVASGNVLGDDLLNEVSLLRAELELLKRAFRAHCTHGDG